ncbi:MAG: hypothetical protein ACTSRU_16310 [Candidatus Hodarchaeales archaeon]
MQIWDLKKNQYEVHLLKNGKKLIAPRPFSNKFWRRPPTLRKFIRDFTIFLKKQPEEAKIINEVKKLSLRIDEAFHSYLEWQDTEELKASLQVKVGITGEDSVENVCDVVQDGNSIYMKNFKKIVHPSIDLIDGVLYIGTRIPYPNKDRYENTGVLVSSDGGLTLTNHESMESMGLELKSSIPEVTPRWSSESIKKIIRGYRQSLATSYSEYTSNTRLTLLYDVESKIGDYIEFFEGLNTLTFISLWCIGTYFHRLFKAYPYVFLNGLKASGKTKTLEVCNQICFNSFLSTGMSTASLFRMIEVFRPTIMIDEGESLRNKERRESFREIILSGYKNGAKTYRVEEFSNKGVKGYTVKEFDLYCPKMLANITGLESILESRCISLTMKAALNQKIANNDVDLDDPEWQTIRDKIYEMLFFDWDEVKKIYDSLENNGGFKNREWELWRPILSLAKYFGTDYYDRMLEYSRQKIEEMRMEEISETFDFLLVKTLLKKVERDEEFYLISEIKNWVAENYDYENIPNWLTPRYVGSILKRLGFKNKRRTSAGIEVFITKMAVRDQAARMNIETEENEPQEDKSETDAKEKKIQQTLG